MYKMSIQDKLEDWAKNSYPIYEELSKQYDLAFYTQSPLTCITRPVKVVVMGINPGSGGSFSDMKKNTRWGFNKLKLNYQHLLRGNVVDWPEHSGWRYWQNIMSLLSAAFPDIRENESRECVFTNATFFNTPKAREVFETLYDRTLPLSLQLIEILSPEIALSLSPDNFNRMARTCGNDFHGIEVFGRKLMLGKYRNTLFVSIYHPAYHYSGAYKNLVRKSLKIISENHALSMDEISGLLHDSLNEEWLELNTSAQAGGDAIKQLAPECLELIRAKYQIEESADRVLTIELNDFINVKVVAQSSNQYMYFRHINFSGKRQYNSEDALLPEIYPRYREVMELLAAKGYSASPTSLGTKSLSEFGASGAGDLAEAICREIQDIEDKLNGIYPAE